MNAPVCPECGREVWGVAKIMFRLGIELPKFLHNSCYEKLKDKQNKKDK